jgi:hypothetical protein
MNGARVPTAPRRTALTGSGGRRRSGALYGPTCNGSNIGCGIVAARLPPSTLDLSVGHFAAARERGRPDGSGTRSMHANAVVALYHYFVRTAGYSPPRLK